MQVYGSGGAQAPESSSPLIVPVAFGCPGLMSGRAEHRGDAVVITLEGEFDLASRDIFADAMSVIEEGSPPAIVVDLEALAFLDSSGIHALLQARQRATGSHGFAIRAGTGPARRTLELAGLHELLAAEPPAG